MEYFLHSEIARLVYGYLVDESCQSAADIFLETSPHLKECHSVVKKGRKFDTKKCGKNLIEILELLSDVSCLVSKFMEKPGNDLNEFMVDLSKALILPHEACQIDSSISKETRDKIEKIRAEQGRVDNKVIKENQEISPILESEDIVYSDKELQNRPVLQVLLEKKDWHERLAENINKAVSREKTGSNEKLSFERVFEKKTVETIVNTLEADPTFEEILKELAGINESCQEQEVEDPVEVEDSPGDTCVVEEPLEQKLVLKPEPKKLSNIIPPKVTHIPVKQAQVLNPLVLSPTSNFAGFSNTVLTSTPKILIQSPQTVYQASSSSTQLLSVTSTPNTPESQNLSCSTSSMPCAVISRFTTPYEIVGPKVFFKKDPNTIVSPNSRIHIKSNTLNTIPDILPKTMEPLKVQIDEMPENTILDKHDEPIVFKRSGVRTRGGKRRGGKAPNRLKAIAPITESPNPIQLYVVTNQTLSEPKENAPLSNVQIEDTPLEIQSKLTPEKENGLIINEEKPMEVTPVQSQSKTVHFRKRLSLSSPRRGSHIRTLEFKTPQKGIHQRKANTSPKNVNLREPLKQLKNVKRGCLFKSPSPNKLPETENIDNAKKSWDSDLRLFAENVDIPTSVGLQRKTLSDGKAVNSKEIILDAIQEESLNECKHSKISEPIENDLILSDSNASPIPSPVKFMSPNSFTKSPSASLESTLIKECVRIESLKKEEKDKTETLDIHIFRTPAKSVSIKPKNTVEMTPISKIRQEINELGKTKLVTPTLPQTPKINETPEPEVSPTLISEIKSAKKNITKTPKIAKKKSPQKKIKLIPASSTPALKKKKKDFDVQKTIAKCLEQAKNSLYGNKSSQNEIKKIQKNSPQKTPNSDPQTKEKRDDLFDEESCESFPSLYLSEDDLIQETEQNQILENIILDKSHLKKNTQIIDLPEKIEKCVPKKNYKKTSHQNKDTPKNPVIKETQKQPDKIDLSQKGNLLKNYLDNFKFDFSVADDKIGEFTTKYLKISQFIHLFDLPPNDKIQNIENKSKTNQIKSERRTCNRRSNVEHENIKKRRRSSSDDDDLQKKRTCSNRLSFKDNYSDKRYYPRDRHYHRYRERRHSPRRPRYSHTYKEDTPARNRTRVEERNDYRLRKGFNTPKNREREKNDRKSKSENYGEETIKFKKTDILEIIEQNKKLNKMLQERNIIVQKKTNSVKEDGEISDCSDDETPKRNSAENIFSRKSGQRESPSVADDSRKLLKELDVDSFLSIVHGKT